jgi:hypothetical protein
MSLTLVIDPALEASAEQFVADWNAEPTALDLALARLEPAGMHSFDFGLSDVIILLTIQMATAVAGNALYDLIKDLLIKQGVRKRIRFMYERQPDGSETLLVEEDEEQ